MISLSSFFISPLRSAGITPTLRVGVCVITLLAVWLGWVRGAEAASLHLSPVTGSFEVDATFDVGVYLDTEGQAVNAVAVNLAFPPDKLQLVSPVVAGQSIVEVWSAQPRFSNQDGLVELAGGIPGGITTSRGLITTLHFRVRSVGTALVRYQDSSQVLLHDGKGTNALYDTSSGIFELTLPAPAGPEVVSVTHPDQAKWYPSSNVSLGWEGEAEVEGYSYLLSDKPIDLVDDIAEGKQVSVVYENVADGVHYFHIKSLRKGKWGGVTHRAIKVDSTPPADFPIDIVPAARTIRRQPIIQFSTTDSGSGLSHYEVKLVLLHSNEAQAAENSSFESIFVETQSPYLPPELKLGKYDVIIRAYDQAGSFREVTQRLSIVKAIFTVVGERGLDVRNAFVIPWVWVWVIGLVLVAGVAYLAWWVRRWHYRVEQRKLHEELPNTLQTQLQELREYRKKYGRLAGLVLALLAVSWLWLGALPVQAQETPLAPPYITTVSRDISNEDIFYLGGRTESVNTEVVIYLQHPASGRTEGFSVTSDKRGEWFYRHHTFLPSGRYVLWSQARVGEQLSPPGPQVELMVHNTAVQFGSSRLSYEVIYLGIIILLAALFLGLVAYTAFHFVHGRRKHAALIKEIREAEESVRRGFAVLKRDIQAELNVVRKAKLSKQLSAEEHAREAELMKDLDWVEKYIGKEVWDVEQAERQTG